MIREQTIIMDYLEDRLNTSVEWWTEDGYVNIKANCSPAVGSGKTYKEAADDLLRKIGLTP
jgi:hypothetical protein